MLFYVDYLDYTTRDTSNSAMSHNLLCFRFDLLIFGRDTFCLSTPACVKLKGTTDVLSQLDDFWRNGRILLQLDKKHKKNAKNYFYSRTKKLEGSLSEQRLLGHFEFQAYSDARTPNFFDIYLPQVANVSPSKIFIKKARDTDQLFRDNAIEIVSKNFDSLCSRLPLDAGMQLGPILNEITLQASEKNTLFQRSIVEDAIKEKFAPSPELLMASSSILDQAFALANADTSYAKPLSLILNQLTGKWLAFLLRKTYGHLYQAICGLPWCSLYALSQNESWISLITFINALIYLVQDSSKNKYDNHISELMPKIAHQIQAYQFISEVAKTAKENAKKKAFEMGILSEAQNLDTMINLQLECLRSNQRYLIDTIKSIDLYAARVYDDLTKVQKYEYLRELASKQRQKNYEIFR